jgi:hypothetical protein
MSAWLEHQRPAKMIRLLLDPLALGAQRPADRRRKAIDDQPQRLATYVSIDRFQSDQGGPLYNR